MILVFTHARDLGADLVIRHLARRRLAYRRVNTEFLGMADLQIAFFNGGLAMVEAEGRIESESVRAVWARRFAHPTVLDVMDLEYREFARRELAYLADAFIASVRGLQVNPFEVDRTSGNRLVQATRAVEAGFLVPDTLVTQDPDRAREFVSKHAKVVTKAISFGLLGSMGPRQAYAALVDGTFDMAGLGACPALFQEFIPKRCEWRVTTVGAQVFAARAPAGASVDPIDWRQSPDPSAIFEPAVLPQDVQRRLLCLCAESGLAFGTHDLVESPSGDFYFLETNPAGQWGWLEVCLDCRSVSAGFIAGLRRDPLRQTMLWLLRLVFPVAPFKSAQAYLDDTEQDAVYRANTARLERLILTARKEVNAVAYAHAKDYLSLEDKRSDSIISRGQGLLVAQAFLGALLSLGGAVSSRADLFTGWPLRITSVIVCYIVVQTFLLTRHALISTGAVGYPRVSSSQLADLLAGTEGQTVAGLALRSILNYRTIALLNDWRFISLQTAQDALRNTAVSLGFLVLVVLYLLHYPAPKPADAGGMYTGAIQQSLIDLGTQIGQSVSVAAHDTKRELTTINTTLAAHDTKGALVAIDATLADIRTRLSPGEPSRPPAKTDRGESELQQSDWMAIQHSLKQRGFDPGPIDGLPGRLTRRAIRAYQAAEAAGELTPDEIKLLLPASP